MALEKTLSIIKPDAIAKNYMGHIYQRLIDHKLYIVAAKMQQLSIPQAKKLYVVHQSSPFFDNLVQFISSGPIMIQVLSGENAILRYRELMGATDPQKAAQGTLRADFATSLVENSVHGSDSVESANYEIALFFKPEEIYPSLVA